MFIVLKIVKALSAALLVGLVSAMGFVLHPGFYIVWIIYNRKRVSMWLAIPLLLLSIFLPLQFHGFFSVMKNIDSKNMSSNPFVLYGAFLMLAFIITRVTALKKFNNHGLRYYIAAGLVVLLLTWLLAPIMFIHFYMAAHYPLSQFLFFESSVALWVILVATLYIKYSEDALIMNILESLLSLQRWVLADRIRKNDGGSL